MNLLITHATNFFRGCTADLNPVNRDSGHPVDRSRVASIRETAQYLGNAIQIQIEPHKDRLNRLLHRSDKT